MSTIEKADIPEDQVLKMAEIGCNNTEIAHVFGVTEGSQFYRYQGEEPVIAEGSYLLTMESLMLQAQ